MSGLNERFSDRPMPEWLAAYADGELDPAGRAYVEEWLKRTPSAHDELLTQKQFSPTGELWSSTFPRVGPSSGWAGMTDRIHSAASQPPVPAAAPAKRLYRLAWLSGSLAAGLLAILLLRNWPSGNQANQPASETALTLATDDDVEIVSLPEADSDLVPIGRRPLDGPIVLAGFNDVTLVSVAKDTDGMMPMVQMSAGPNAPMIVAPVPPR